MKKIFLFAVAALLPLMAQAQDAKPTPAAPPAGLEGPVTPDMKPVTLEDARRRAHEMADRLDKMSPKEWKVMQENMHERRAQFMARWQDMTPEQRDQAKAKWMAKHPGAVEGKAPDAPAKPH